jgi:hypothetical protein
MTASCRFVTSAWSLACSSRITYHTHRNAEQRSGSTNELASCTVRGVDEGACLVSCLADRRVLAHT